MPRAMVRAVKGEPATARETAGDADDEHLQGTADRRVLRSRYLAVKNQISDEREDMARADSEMFRSIIEEVENLHQLVQKPREQVADAEALLDIANTLATSVKSQTNEGVTPSDFVTALLRNFSKQDTGINAENSPTIVYWEKIGLNVSRIFKKAPGCQTMIGPMDTEVKQRKAPVQRKRTRPAESTRPEELVDTKGEQKTDTDKNMSTMFDVLRKQRTVRLENLVLNRTSFAQTVENIFALSFLVKDGRAEINVNDSRHHIVSPRNAPTANAVMSGDVLYNHFVFRFDYKDWKLMMDSVTVGDELMTHRCGPSKPAPRSDPTDMKPGPAVRTTPIRKLSRNRGLVIREDSPEKDPLGDEDSLRLKGKRRLFG